MKMKSCTGRLFDYLPVNAFLSGVLVNAKLLFKIWNQRTEGAASSACVIISSLSPCPPSEVQACLEISETWKCEKGKAVRKNPTGIQMSVKILSKRIKIEFQAFFETGSSGY